MADQRTDPVEARLRAYLASELRRAEDDYRSRDVATQRRPGARRGSARLVGAVSALAVVAVLLAGILVLPRVAGTRIGGPDAIVMGDDGLPRSIGGEPVRRLLDMDLWAMDRDYLVGGTLVLKSGACFAGSARAQLECGNYWALVAGPAGGPTIVATLEGAPAAPGFVPTSGALTVIRVGDPSLIDGALSVQAVAWRQPTKGPIPDEANPPDGGAINEALVPDFVSTWDRDGVTIAGYVPKRYLVGGPETTPGTPSDPPQDLPIPVYGEDLVTLVGHDVPGTGFVALGATETPTPFEVSAAPMTEAPVSVAPSGGPEATAPPPASPDPDAAPALECGRIDPIACARAVDLALSVDQGEVVSPSRVVVDDTCPPGSACDRLYPFDSLVVFVTAGADTTGWISFEVTGLEDNLPAAAARFEGDLPAFMVSRVAASTASVFVLRLDLMNRSSQPVVVSATSEAGVSMEGFLPGEQGTIYTPLRSRASTVLVQLLAHPSCRFFAGASYSIGYGETLLIDDGDAGQAPVLSLDPGMFVAPQPLPANDIRCPGG